MNLIRLGRSDLHVTPICLGTMTFGEQVGAAQAHDILDRSLERGVNFLDTAEMYSVPARRETRLHAADLKSASYSRSWARSAQTMRAFLLASATVATFLFRRPITPASQLPAC